MALWSPKRERNRRKLVTELTSSRFHLVLGTLLLAVSALTPKAWADDSSGLQTFVSVDLVGAFNTDEEEKPADDQFVLREAEFALFGPIDHTFDGILSLAAHQEEGVYLLEVHEANIGSSKLIPRSRFRLGTFFLGIGRLNQVHRHDWPFVSAPLVHSAFFDAEGVADTGLEYSILLPTPFYFDMTLGATNGWTYGHTHTAGEKPRQPNQYLRLATFLELPAKGGVQIGVNGLRRLPADGATHQLVGTDVVAKWREGQTLIYLVQMEYWQRSIHPKDGERETAHGFYLYNEYGWTQSVSLGLRLDYFSVMSLKDASDEDVENHATAAVPTLTYRNSEFAKLRLAYNHWEAKTADETKTSPFVEIQSTFLLGAHPAHDF